ncbi:MAG TPA: DNA replication complex GINS family protein [Pyrodictium sp.]|nr:DNA replication complex GINS family protein [Pyrodictium sp.]HIQ55332.1 DNA replication complex GINS family protein [Pyrodictium sp.]
MAEIVGKPTQLLVSKWFQEFLELIELSYRLKPVRVMVVKDYGSLEIDGVMYELRRGTEVEIPRWIAEVLEEIGVVEILETGLSLEDIARIHFSTHSVKSMRELERLPENFYIQAKEYLKELETRIRRELNPMLLEEKQKAELYLVEIVNRRLNMIIQVLRSPASLAEIYEKFSEEEKLLADALRGLIEEWRKKVFGKL